MENLNQLKTFEDACQVEGLDANNFSLELPTIPNRDRDAILAFTKLIVIVRAANRLSNGGKEWLPDWKNYNEDKYFAWFEIDSSSGFRFHGDDYWRTTSGVGSRLCFISRDTCEYIGEQFKDLYKQLMVIDL